LGTLLKAAKGIKETLRKLLTNRRVNVPSRVSNLVKNMQDSEIAYWERYAQNNNLEDIIKAEELPTALYLTNSQTNCITVSDPILQYYDALPLGITPQPVIVAQESESLRSVIPIINQKHQEECILDGGSQIVSMSQETAERLDLHWDPRIRIH